MIRILDNPDSSVGDIVSSIETSLCAKILSIANSAYYSRLQKIENIEHAIGILGRNAIRDIVLGITIYSLFSVENYDATYFDYRKFWHRTITLTQLAMMFGKILKNPDLSKIYTIGLLHDMGEIVFFYISCDDNSFCPFEGMAETKLVKDIGVAPGCTYNEIFRFPDIGTNPLAPDREVGVLLIRPVAFKLFPV